MAVQNRQTYQLPTIRISFEPSRSEGLVLFDCFKGSEMIARAELAAPDIGIRPELNVKAYRDSRFHLPAEICSAIVDPLMEIITPDDLLWLQVGSSSGHLAVVPWERLLQESMSVPLLRIPNFVTDPVIPRGPTRLVLCASSPRAKTSFDIVSYVNEFVSLMSQTLMPGSELHLFTDLASYSAIEGLALSGPLSVIVHNPHEAEEYGVGDVDRRLENYNSELKSPWLRWISNSLGTQAIAAVHFVCPGYFSQDQGALALARSPTDNYDSEWSHFVDAEELISFLNQVGAWYVGFSPPYDNVWAIGLRLLADRLAWQRPGALLLHDTEGGSLSDLQQAFRFLFTQSDTMPPASPYLMLYSHPARLSTFRDQNLNFASVSTFGMPALDEADASQLEELVHKMSAPELEDSIEQAGWQQSGQRLMDQILLQAKGQDEATQQGTLDALDKLSSLFKGDVI